MRSMPGARATRFGSVSAARMNVNRPTIPNWSPTIPAGMFEMVPKNEVIQQGCNDSSMHCDDCYSWGREVIISYMIIYGLQSIETSSLI